MGVDAGVGECHLWPLSSTRFLDDPYCSWLDETKGANTRGVPGKEGVH